METAILMDRSVGMGDFLLEGSMKRRVQESIKSETNGYRVKLVVGTVG